MFALNKLFARGSKVGSKSRSRSTRLGIEARESVARLRKRLGVESLEDRQTPSTWVVNLPQTDPEALFRYVELHENLAPGMLYVTINNQIVAQRSATGVDQIELNGTSLQEIFVARGAGVRLTINGAGADALIVVGTGGNDLHTVTPHTAHYRSLSTSAQRLINHWGLKLVQVNAGGGNDQIILNPWANGTTRIVALGEDGADKFLVRSSSPDHTGVVGFRLGAIPGVEVEGGAGPDRFVVGYGMEGWNSSLVGSSTLDRYAGTVRISGETGEDTISIHDNADTTNNSYTISSSRLTRGSTKIEYSGVERLDLHAGRGNDNVWFTSSNMRFAAYGRDGADTLTGGGGHDLLDGGNGADILRGGLGFDVLIGGDGYDLLYGEGGEDLLVGGWVNDPADELDVVRAYWFINPWGDVNLRAEWFRTYLDNYATRDAYLDIGYISEGPDLYYDLPQSFTFGGTWTEV